MCQFVLFVSVLLMPSSLADPSDGSSINRNNDINVAELQEFIQDYKSTKGRLLNAETRLHQAEQKIQEIESQKASAENVRQLGAMHLDTCTNKNTANITMVGFSACLSKPELADLGVHQIIDFDKVLSNVGNAYHQHTGIFTAPVKGVYVFHVTAMVGPQNKIYLEFTHDGTGFRHLYPDAGSLYSFMTASDAWVMTLDAGSEVWVRVFEPGVLRGYCFSTFSGFLLNELE